ncbi:MAG TPA: GNAT family N-acetyltransferase [Thermoplasmata archaeon]|nr:GNAT family N-acetyltransferase [Thermoplasmata archaeon]
MLRRIRRADVPDITVLLDRNFPEENRLLGMRPEEVGKVADRILRPQIRFLVGLARLFRRPVFSFFVIEDGGRVVATSLVTYGPRSGYVAMVSVDTPHRRKGYAAQTVMACIDDARRSGKPFAVLDVLEQNAPARALYAKLGFLELARRTFYARDLADGPPITEVSSTTLRRFEPRDAARLTAIGQRALSPTVAAVLPSSKGDFTTPPRIAAMLVSETEAWVTGWVGDPRGFVRATVGRTTEAANLTAPLLHPELADGDAQALVARALAWASERRAPRIVTEVPDSDARAIRLLEGAGFVASIRTLTLYRTTAP